MTPTATPPPQAPTPAQIVKQYGKQLKDLVEKNCLAVVDREKIAQTSICRRNDFYFRGIQHLVPQYGGGGEITDYKPLNGQMLLASNSGNQGRDSIYDYVINNFRGDVRKFVGVLGNKAPNCRAMPDWASDDTGVRRSAIATDCISFLDSQWDVDASNRQLALSLAKNGTSFIHTTYVTDGDRFGTFTEPVWGTRPEQVTPDAYMCPQCGASTPGEQDMPPMACQQCGGPLGPQDFVPGETQDVPAIVDEKEYPNGTVEMSIHSAYDVTTPFYIKDLEHCPWLILDDEDDAAFLVSRYPGQGLEEKLESEGVPSNEMGGGSAVTLGRIAREQASSPTGYMVQQRPNRWRHTRVWAIPAMFKYLMKDDDKALAGLMKKQFPRGAKMVFVNGTLVQIEAERLDEVWAAVKSETSEYLWSDAIFNDYVQIADVANDLANISIQLGETSVQAILYDPNVLDKRKINNGWGVNEFIPTNPGTLTDKSFYKIPVSEPSSVILQFIKELIATAREIIGLLPAIWGGDAVANETAEAARRRLNQALMVLSTTWNEMRGGWAKARRNGVRQLARYSLGRLVSSQGDAESISVQEIKDIEDLLKGGWHCVCDQAIPMNWTQLRDFVQSMFTMSPEMVTMFGFNLPDNLRKIEEGIGIPGWILPGLDERNRVHDLIGELMKGAPIPGLDGMPQPSITIDFTVTYRADKFFETIHDWAVSEEGNSADGTPGYANVIAAGHAALNAMAPPPAPMPGGGVTGNGGALPPGNSAPTLPETLPGANAPTQPEAPLPPLPQDTGLLHSPPAGAVQ